MPDTAHIEGSLAPEDSPPSTLDLTELFRAHGPFVFRVLRRLGVRDADVDDTVQEVFIVVHRKLGDFEARSTVRTWIYGIAVRVASDHRRRARMRHEVTTDAPPEIGVQPSQLEDMAKKQARASLDRILDELDDDKRNVFVLYEIEQLPMAEVAQVVGCPLQTAYSRLHAGRKIVEARVQALRSEEERR